MTDIPAASPVPAPATGWFSGFRRITTSGGLIPEIDGLRLLAVFFVLHSHVTPFLPLLNIPVPGWFDPPVLGYKGVELFFTISGFILGLPFAKRALLHSDRGTSKFQTSYGAYLLRRVTRLEPPYVLALSLRFVLLITAVGASWRAILPHFLATLFYCHSLIYKQLSTVSPPMWSLEVEVQFYLLAPLLAVVFKLRSAALRRGLMLAVMALQAWANMHFYVLFIPRLQLSLVGHFSCFVAGFLLCDLYVTGDLQRCPRWVCNLVTPLCLGALLYLPNFGWLAAIPALTFVLYVAVLRGSFSTAFFRSAVVSTLGGMCYSIYLMQRLAMFAAEHLLQHAHADRLGLTHPWLALVLCYPVGIVLSVAIGAVYFRYVERPFMRKDWPQRALSLFTSRSAVETA